MRVISVITTPTLIDRLLCHVRGRKPKDDDCYDPRAPPAA
jgi:hypothetical protein